MSNINDKLYEAGLGLKPTHYYCESTGCLEEPVDGTYCIVHSPVFNEAVKDWEKEKERIEQIIPYEHTPAETYYEAYGE